ncbi:hypothetical protein [Alkalibacillus haloalkaliphilus]|uniref:Uncharacterized protein n=1 Tax=Alkalibacillus haloalkaliphilus TaxID=94136 RepID=A0A511W0G6_9BACI|nr:hypothetical protein [Alkalibacillus haloalkaliphilus]GEN44555.1 hypothetical protein AHA02nite_03310 [Alkalibacillus haloalkaliphilus]
MSRKQVVLLYLFWILLFPTIIIGFRVVVDWSVGNLDPIMSYIPVWLGIATGGILAGLFVHSIKKAN